MTGEYIRYVMCESEKSLDKEERGVNIIADAGHISNDVEFLKQRIKLLESKIIQRDNKIEKLLRMQNSKTNCRCL